MAWLADKSRTAWPGRDTSVGWLSVAAAVGAILAASCCVLPLAFSLLGLGGTWAISLGFLSDWRPYIMPLSLGLIGMGWWLYYRRRARKRSSTMSGSSKKIFAILTIASGASAVAIAISLFEWPLINFLLEVYVDA